jgi:hypothetical protein
VQLQQHIWTSRCPSHCLPFSSGLESVMKQDKIENNL